MKRILMLFTAMAVTLVVASGLALAVTKIGTNGPDTLRGTNGADNLIGKGGNDVLFGLDGRDNLLGGEGKDWVIGGNERGPQGGDKDLVGGPGNDGVVGGTDSDTAIGGTGNDFVQGGRGSDRVVGEEGRDYLDGGRGSARVVGEEGGDLLYDGPFRETAKDTLSGGDGDDIFIVNNRRPTRDLVLCGDGFARVLVDRQDVTSEDCERVFTRMQPFVESIPPAVVEFFVTFLEEQVAPSPITLHLP
jgi:Ca2+-binding RTX toxin-like protein